MFTSGYNRSILSQIKSACISNGKLCDYFRLFINLTDIDYFITEKIIVIEDSFFIYYLLNFDAVSFFHVKNAKYINIFYKKGSRLQYIVFSKTYMN